MGRMKIAISSKLLYRLYWNYGWAPNRIGQKFGCDRQTIANRLEEFGIPKKTSSYARQRYARQDFGDEPEEKAYMLGMKFGDLNSYRKTPNSETIIIRCHTTQFIQAKLVKSLFNRYGRVTVTHSANGYYVNAYLNNTFDFLLDDSKIIPNWVEATLSTMCAFVAGYVDAEGNFIINQGRARFKIDSYDVNILKKINVWLERQNINTKCKLLYREGEKLSWGRKPFKHDLWRLNVNVAESVKQFISLIKPFARHETRISQMKKCEINVVQRQIEHANT